VHVWGVSWAERGRGLVVVRGSLHAVETHNAFHVVINLC